jgi:epoxyqueuosine reductase
MYFQKFESPDIHQRVNGMNEKTVPDMELYKNNPNLFIENTLKAYVEASPLNHLPTFDNAPIFMEPVVVFGNGDDDIFKEYKTIIGDFHLTPREAMEKHLAAKRWRYGLKGKMENLSIISYALSYPLETRMGERESTYGGSKRYNHTRWRGGVFLDVMLDYMAALLEIMGYTAVAPTRSKFFETKQNPAGFLMANWSERHIAYACGMGTFGLHGLIISPVGSAIYLSSIVCDLELRPTPRKYQDHLEYCLFRRDGSCRKCLERCPAGAISDQGRSNIICRENLTRKQPEKLKELGVDKELLGPAPACGVCSTGVPCEERVP